MARWRIGMVRALVVALSVAVVPTGSLAARWVPIDRSAAASSYLDADQIVRDGDVVTIWLKVEFAAPGKKGEARTIEKWMHDCANNRAKLLALTLYKANGTVIGSAESPRYDLEWETLPNGSVAEEIHEKVCDLSP
jgi:hypothetical protein